MDKLVKTLGIHALSKSQVSRMATDLDENINEFRHRSLAEAGPFTFVAADALTMKVREGGRVINTVVLIATGVNGDGRREVLGLQVATSETGPAWNAFFRRPHRPRAHRCPARHLRRARRAEGRDRREPARSCLAEMPNPLRREPDDGDTEEHVAGRESNAPQCL
jgi:hypothetical protein